MRKLRERIITAAGDLFAEYGYPNVSTKQIASRIGINESTILRRFGSKEELGRAVARSLTEWYATEETPDSFRRLDLETFARLIVARNVDNLTARWMRIYFALCQYFPAELAYKVPTKRHELFIEKISEYQRNGLIIPGNPSEIAAALLYAIYGFFSTVYVVHHPAHPGHKSCIELIVKIWLRGIQA